MRILVTGGRGFLGSHVDRALREAGHEVVVLGRADGDLAEAGEADRLVAEHAPDAVVHLAAVMPGDERLGQNAPITALVAAACQAHGLPLYHGSSTAVHGDDTPYAASKRASEEAAAGATMLRFHYPYGPGQRRGAIPTMLRQALAGEDVVVYRGWERSFCFAGDVASAVALIVERSLGGAWEVGRDDDLRPLADVALLACAAAGADSRLVRLVEPPDGPAPVLDAFDASALRTLGWEPAVELEDGMRRTFGWVASGAA